MFVSIVTVNYNGKRLLKDFLESTFALDYPSDKYEVIVVDNASTDGSVSYIKSNFPKVNVVISKTNLGFGAGNNLGIKNANGELFFLINNDTVLDKAVLKEAISCFLNWSKKKKVGAVNTKLVLFDTYLPFVLKGATYTKYQVSKNNMPKNKKHYVVIHGRGGQPWEEIYIPINHNCKDNLLITISVRKTGAKYFKLFLKSILIAEEQFSENEELKNLTINLTSNQLKNSKINLIQNAGSILFRDGFGRDRGVEIINYKQYYEPDKGQYDKEEQIPLFCGAGVFLNKKALGKVGLFDKRFFMYYEDGDLSLRLKRAGWEILYCPKALVRHIHAGSSKEWSPFFIFNVERNRLLFVAKHWPRLFALKEWLKYLLKDTLSIPFYYFLAGQQETGHKRLMIRLKVNLSLILPFTMSLLQGERLSYGQLKKLF